MTLYQSTGRLHYESTKTSYKLIVEVDPGIAFFYRSLIPKYFQVAPQKYPPHVSVVRKETPKKLSAWGRYENHPISFFYDPDIQCDDVYWWLNIYCVRLEQIRRELGLPVTSPYTVPPDGFQKCFHMTIGNRKLLV